MVGNLWNNCRNNCSKYSPNWELWKNYQSSNENTSGGALYLERAAGCQAATLQKENIRSSNRGQNWSKASEIPLIPPFNVDQWTIDAAGE